MKEQIGIDATTESNPPKTHEVTGPLDDAKATDPEKKESSRATNLLFRAIYQNTPIMMHSIGMSHELVSVNRNWLETMGYEEAEVIGRKSSDFLTEASRRYAVEVALPRFLKTGAAKDVAYQMVKKNGEVIDVLLSAVAEIDSDGQFLGSYCYILDVNEYRKSEELWRQLSLVEERNRMSRDLHGTVEHSLIGIMLRTDTARRLMESDPSMARAELESTHALARLGLEQTRRAVWDLEPLAITSKRLREVISRGLERLGDEGMRTSLTVDEEGNHEMDERNKLAIIRIVQEALSNVRLHSRANMVQVRLSYTTSEVMLTIIDDGVGFDLSATHNSMSSASSGIGLANMRESARLAGGSVDVRSTPGSGTQIEVRIPFEYSSNQGRALARRHADDEHPALTNRELQVLKILANGGRNKDIAAEMSVSLRAVKFHIENMYRKLDVRTHAELISVAAHQGLLAE